MDHGLDSWSDQAPFCSTFSFSASKSRLWLLVATMPFSCFLPRGSALFFNVLGKCSEDAVCKETTAFPFYYMCRNRREEICTRGAFWRRLFEGYSCGKCGSKGTLSYGRLEHKWNSTTFGVFFFEPQHELLEKQMDGFLSQEVFNMTSFDESFLSVESTVHECQSRYQDFQYCNISVSVWVDTVSNENAPTSEEILTGLRSTWETAEGFDAYKTRLVIEDFNGFYDGLESVSLQTNQLGGSSSREAYSLPPEHGQ